MKKILIIIVIALLVKIIYVLFSYGVKQYNRLDAAFNYESIIDVFKKNDTYWYEKISLEGYPSIRHSKEIGFHDGPIFNQSAWAFFPFYPILITIIKNITGLNIDSSLLAISIIFSLLLFVLFYFFTLELYGSSSEALFFVLLLITMPFHYYFSVFYTESIFLLLIIVNFYAVLIRKYLIMFLMIIPLVLIRPNGIIILIPLYLFMLEHEGLLKRYKFNFKGIFSKKNIKLSFYFVSGPIAFVAYAIYQYYMTGEFFAFNIAQKGWYRDFMFPFLAFFRHGDMATQFNSVYTILFVLLALIAWKKLPLSFNILIWLSVLLPLASGSVMSMPRFISVIFPFTIIIGKQFFQMKNKWSMLGIIFLIQLASFYFWVVDDPLSY
jgi:Gpi18-like mannosyltransferase